MCGLAGIFETKGNVDPNVLRADVRAMAATLTHRGPDDDGDWLDAGAGIAFGFRRLSILDLTETGHQPMQSADGRYVLMFNGEIYNFEELKAELSAAGASFRGGSDTEVALEAFARWGVRDAVRRFNGMFAFALWDRAERRLHLIRDRIGVKPLYWTAHEGTVLFASELKALRGCGRWTPRLDDASAATYFRLGYIPAPYSIYEGVEKLAPGHGVTIDAGGRTERWRYWSLADAVRNGREKAASMSMSAATETFTRLFEDAAAIRTRADVPVGAFLSGGYDSTAVVTALAKSGHADIETFSIGFESAAFDESGHAATVAKHLGLANERIVLTDADALALMDGLAEAYDEPFADSSQLPMLAVSKLARRKVTVSLSGDGGDELFAGYTRHRWADETWRRVERVPRCLRRLGGGIAGAVPNGLGDGLFGLLPSSKRPAGGMASVRWAAGLAAAENYDAFYQRVVALDQHAKGGAVRGADWRDDPAAISDDPLERLLYADTVQYLPDDILVKLDRASMAVSLEAREPFLDHRLVEFAWTLPKRAKLSAHSGKRLIRDYVHAAVPAAVMERPKQGFSVPIDAWIRGGLKDQARDLLLAPSGAGFAGISNAEAAAMLESHLNGAADNGAMVWALMVFEKWRRRWIN